MTIPKTLRTLLGVGLLCGAGLAVRADDTVTFQVDLSSYTNGAGLQAASLVDVRGAFNGWSGGSGATLVNNGANVYTNTFTVAGLAAATFQYKFTFTTPIGVTWEDNNPPPGAGQPPDSGNNRVLALVGGAQTLPVVPFYAPSVTLPIELPTNNITYRVDMTEQIQLGNFIPSSGADTIRVTGAPVALGPWNAGVDLTNNPALSGDASNIYSAVIGIQGVPGALGGEFKFRLNGGWEDTSDNANRNFKIVGGDQVLPVVYYGDQVLGAITNANVTFQVDMTPQVIAGGFTNGTSVVEIDGSINGSWGRTPMTNDPSLSGNARNIYSMTIALPNATVATPTVGMWFRYKFRADLGWESAAIYGVGNNKDRRMYLTGGDQVLPVVTYNDASLCDILLQPTTTTFVLHLTNGTPDNTGIPFDKTSDVIYLNADFINWNAANGSWNATTLPQMTNNPVGSDFYEQTFVINGGNSRRLQFKFGVSGPGHGTLDVSENPFQVDHVAYMRGTGPTFTMPVAQFGSNFVSSLVEPVFGNLKAGTPVGANVPISWLGYPCTTLQSRSSAAGGVWIDHPATDAANSTNWPNTGGSQFFRLQKRPLP